MSIADIKNARLVNDLPTHTLTKEEHARMDGEIDAAKHLYDNFVCINEFILFSLIDLMLFRIDEYNKENNIIKPKSKTFGDLKKCLQSSKQLTKKSRKYEKNDIVNHFARLMPYYYQEYMREGGIYYDTLTLRSAKILEDDINTIEKQINEGLTAVGVKDVKFLTEVITASLLCGLETDLLRNTTDMYKQVLTAITHEKYGQKQIIVQASFRSLSEFEVLKFRLKNIATALVGKLNFLTDASLKIINERKQAIMEKMFTDKLLDMEMEVTRITASDYADYCVAQMLIHYRQHREIVKPVADKLYSLGMKNRDMNALMQEFDDAEICLGEHDAHEVKLWLDEITKRTKIDYVRALLNVCTKND